VSVVGPGHSGHVSAVCMCVGKLPSWTTQCVLTGCMCHTQQGRCYLSLGSGGQVGNPKTKQMLLPGMSLLLACCSGDG
jgi:hypothetical protein